PSSSIRIVGMLSTSLLTSQVACSHVCLLGVKSYRRTVYAAASPGSALSQSQHWPARPRLTSWIRRYITLIERRTHTSPAPRFCQTNSTLRRPSVYPLRRRHSVDRPSGPRAPISAKQTRALSARARWILPLPPHPQSDLADASPPVPFRADSASAKGFHKRAVGFPQSKAKRGSRRDRHGRLLNRGPRTNFDGARGSKESVSGGRQGSRDIVASRCPSRRGAGLASRAGNMRRNLNATPANPHLPASSCRSFGQGDSNARRSRL